MDPITRAVIDCSALMHNLAELRRLVGPRAGLAPCVKADAYGHGLLIAARAAVAGGAAMLCVAQLPEAAAVRAAGLDVPILVFAPPVAGSEHGYLDLDCRATVIDLDSARRLNDAAGDAGRRIRVHVKVDTGMGRLGALPNQAAKLVRAAQRMKGLLIEGIYSHLATADEDDLTFARLQLRRFRRLLKRLHSTSICPPICHAANSAATIDLPASHFNLVRPGLAFYGYYGHRRQHERIDLRPAMRVVSRVASVKRLPAGHGVGYGLTFRCTRQTRVAMVPIGYGDGFDRRLGHSAYMAVNGRLCPVIGRVSMDQTLLDVTDAGDVQVGDEVIVISPRREDPNSAESLARRLWTIPYEVTCALGTRVARVMTGRLPQTLHTAEATPQPARRTAAADAAAPLAEPADAVLEEQLRSALTDRLYDPRRGVTTARRRRAAAHSSA
jgi:alanine racemase